MCYAMLYQKVDRLWTVGTWGPDGQWYAFSDHATEEEASRQINYLNGGCGLPIGEVWKEDDSERRPTEGGSDM